jgi:hypothetical protein
VVFVVHEVALGKVCVVVLVSFPASFIPPPYIVAHISSEGWTKGWYSSRDKIMRSTPVTRKRYGDRRGWEREHVLCSL